MDPDQTAPDLGSHCLLKEACIGGLPVLKGLQTHYRR